jgi:hypothetical protein
MRRISVHSRDDGAFEVGPAGHNIIETVMVTAENRGEALRKGKKKLLATYGREVLRKALHDNAAYNNVQAVVNRMARERKHKETNPNT